LDRLKVFSRGLMNEIIFSLVFLIQYYLRNAVCQRLHWSFMSAPRYAAPRYAAPRYAAPCYAAPRYAAPHYAAPLYAAPR
jgi:hypothetical protein